MAKALIIHCFFGGAAGISTCCRTFFGSLESVVVVVLRFPLVFGEGLVVPFPFVFPFVPGSFNFKASRVALLVLPCPFAIFKL